jgi:hypothetical protein
MNKEEEEAANIHQMLKSLYICWSLSMETTQIMKNIYKLKAQGLLSNILVKKDKVSKKMLKICIRKRGCSR